MPQRRLKIGCGQTIAELVIRITVRVVLHISYFILMYVEAGYIIVSGAKGR